MDNIMPAIGELTKQKIKAYLEVFIESKVQDYKSRKIPVFEDVATYLGKKSKPGRLKPFHAAIIPEPIMRINAFERGFSTSLGTTFEECARLIALDHHQHAERGYDVTSMVSQSAVDEIEHQVAFYDRDVQDNVPNKLPLTQMIATVLAARRNDDLERRTVRADLYVLSQDGTHLFFEIKSPKPNKGQCFEVTQRILRFHLLMGQDRPNVRAYFAMAYNPYGPDRDSYRWSIPQKYMPFADAVVIAQDFWTLIGGPSTYQELLEIYCTVGKEKHKYILDALAFGF